MLLYVIIPEDKSQGGVIITCDTYEMSLQLHRRFKFDPEVITACQQITLPVLI
jgi:hypothetical protein